MKLVYGFISIICLLCVACGQERTTQIKSENLEIIPLEDAFEKQSELKMSDCFKKVCYVPLETTNEGLIGELPSVQVMNDYIIVTSGVRDKDYHVFDKQTGRFIRTIGHAGNDPTGYAPVSGGWINPHTNELYLPGWNNKMVVYGVDGEYKRHWKSPIAPSEFPVNAIFDYVDAELIAGYYPATDSLPVRIALFRNEDIERVDTLLQGHIGEKERSLFGIDHLVVLRIPTLVIKDKEGCFFTMPRDNCFWQHDGMLYFKIAFNDTIYQVSTDKKAQPIRVLDLGKYDWPYEKRHEEVKNAIFTDYFLEGKDVLLFNCATGIYGDYDSIKYYFVCYRKSDGTVIVSPLDKIVDDLNGFLPVRPQSDSRRPERLPARASAVGIGVGRVCRLPASIRSSRVVCR